MPRMRAMTIGGMCLFLEIDEVTWRHYARGERGDDEPQKAMFSSICSRVAHQIREQKFTGAAGGFLNPSIIARDLGLADKKEFTGPGGGPLTVDHTMNPKAAADAYEASLREGEPES
jgi:hypothetical protein